MTEGTRTGATVSRGAEATLREGDWWGFPVLIKDREAKGYRPKEFDDRLRRDRIRTEARLLVEARRAGVRTPLIYDVDMTHARIILERLPGPTLKEILEDPSVEPARLERAVRAFGRALGLLHAAPISHGDLTSSNVLFPEGPDGPPALLDLSMGSRQPGIEELGIDLHLVEEDFKSLVPRSEVLMRAFLAGYADGHPHGHAEVVARAKAIRGRVRYA